MKDLNKFENNKEQRGFDATKRASKKGGRKVCNMDTLTTNDITYYNKYPHDLEVAAKIPWFKILGRPISWTEYFDEASNRPTTEEAFPGVMVIDYVPGFGQVRGDGDDPINRAYTQIMAELFSKIASDKLGFEQADLAMQQISFSSIAGLIAEAKRALSTVDFWITKNAYYPRVLLKAMGFSYDDIIANRPAYLTRLNSLIHMFNNVELPKFMDVFNRQYAMSHNVFMDEDSEFAQIYIFKMKGYYEYFDVDNPEPELYGPNYAKYVECPNHFNSFGDFLSIIERLLSRWYYSTDLYTINGALKRAYKDAEMIKLEDATLSDIIDPVRDRYFMYQIMNMQVAEYSALDQDSLCVRQNPLKSRVIWAPRSKATNYLGLPRDGVLLKVFEEEVTIEDNVEMTRMCMLAEPGLVNAGTKDKPNYVSCEYFKVMGTEIPVGVRIFYLVDDTSSSTVMDDTAVHEVKVISNSQAGTRFATGPNADRDVFLSKILLLEYFRYIPTVPVLTTEGTIRIPGDLYNYTTAGGKTLAELNKVCMLSMWKPNLDITL